MEQDTKRKVGAVTGASTLGGSLGVVLAYLLTLIGWDVPMPVQLAMVALLCALGGWLIKPGTGARRK